MKPDNSTAQRLQALRDQCVEVKKCIQAAQTVCSNEYIIQDKNTRKVASGLLGDLQKLISSNDKILDNPNAISFMPLIKDTLEKIRDTSQFHLMTEVPKLSNDAEKTMLTRLLQAIVDKCPRITKVNVQGSIKNSILLFDSHLEVKDGDYYRAQVQKQKQRQAKILRSGEWQLPKINTDHFVPRQKLIEQLNQYFHPDQLTENSSNIAPRALGLSALHGLGGIGKTQLAAHYVQANQKHYKFRCWFHVANLASEYRQFAEEMGLVWPNEEIDKQELQRRIKVWFKEQQDWLIVYDGAENLGELEPYIPQGNGHVLVTSRNALPWQRQGKSIEVGVMNETEAVTLLTKIIKQHDKNAPELAKELGYLPLALAQAGAYIQTAAINVAEYLSLFRDAQQRLLDSNRLGVDNLGQPRATIATIWELSLKAIKASPDGAKAMTLLNCCASLAPVPIKDSLSLRCLSNEDEINTNTNTKLDLNVAKRLLQQYSMISIKQPKLLMVHQLVQTVIRHQQADQQWLWLKKTCLATQHDYGTNREQLEDYHNVSLFFKYLILIASHLFVELL